MTPDLDQWLKVATRGLSTESAAQVRKEIQEHYEAALEGGDSQTSLAALGDARVANMQYRRVLLTASEAKLLQRSTGDAWIFSSRPWVQGLLLLVSLLMLLGATALLRFGSSVPGRIALALGLGIAFTLLAPRLPIYSPVRARAFRPVRWIVQIALFFVAFGPGALPLSWLLILCFGQFIWAEWKRASIRRKLPVVDWPRQLYL